MESTFSNTRYGAATRTYGVLEPLRYVLRGKMTCSNHQWDKYRMCLLIAVWNVSTHDGMCCPFLLEELFIAYQVRHSSQCLHYCER